MKTFILGILILITGYVFYSKYINNLFSPDDRETPAIKNCDGVVILFLYQKTEMR